MQIPRTLINNYTKGINGLSASARASIARTMSEFEFSGDVANDRDRIIALMSACLRPYLSVVVPLSVEFYNVVRVLSIGESLDQNANVSDVYDQAKTEEAVRAFMQNEVDGNTDKIPELLGQRVDYEMKLAAIETVQFLGRRDSAKPRWARVPSGAETCEFCLALASQTYRTEESASTHIHTGCDCRIVPKFRGESIEGYDPDAYKRRWRESIESRAEKNDTTYEEEYEKRYGTEARKRRRKASRQAR